MDMLPERIGAYALIGDDADEVLVSQEPIHLQHIVRRVEDLR